MPTLRVNDIQLYYEITGHGPPLVLIPGLSSDVSEYAPIIRLLAPDYQVIALDNRGAGRSDKPDSPYTIAQMAGDVAGLLAALAIPPATILGISLGGRIAVELALNDPARVRRLILVSTCVQARVQRDRAHRLLDLALRMPLWRAVGSQHPQPAYALRRQRDAIRHYDAMARLPQIQAPTLILHGLKDRLAPYALAAAMQAAIPDAQLVSFRGGHLFLFFQPQAFGDAIRAWMRRRDAADP